MSALEIIDEIKKLPREEQQRIAIYLDELKKENAGNPSSGTVNEEFKRIADKVFKTNDELFRKLAQ